MPKSHKTAGNKERVPEAKARIIAAYTKLAAKMGLHPSLSDMLRVGYTRNAIRHHFGSMTDLTRAAKDADPKAFSRIIDGDLLSPRRFAEVRRTVAGFQRFIVTTAVTGAPLNKPFMASIKTYCDKHKAKLLVLPSMDPAAAVSSKHAVFDPALQDALVLGDLPLNENLFLSSIKLSAKHIDPITGLGRIGQRDGSFIYASPKQRLKMVPTANTGLPHALMTTGACTDPAYDSDRYMSHRTAYIANHDHVIGAIVVEVQDEKTFHFRQVQADRRGQFADLGKLYHPDGIDDLRPEVLVLGDWHSQQTDPVAREQFITGKNSVRALLRPRVAVVHDGFDGLSINHHEQHDRILRARRSADNQLSLEAELRKYAADLDMMAEHFEEVVVVMSNHDEFLYRYLTAGLYLDDPLNHAVALRIASQVVDHRRNAVQVGCEMFGLKHRDRITWLDYDDDYKIAGIELASHGHKGPNGAKGSLRGMEAAYGQSSSGHTHTPEILRGAWCGGTCSYLKQDYNKGPSSWMQTSTLIYPTGGRQLINLIGPHWRI